MAYSEDRLRSRMRSFCSHGRKGDLVLFKTFNEDRPFIERKYHDPQKPFDPYKRRAYHGYPYPEHTGLDDDTIKAGLSAMVPVLDTLPHPVAKAKAIAYVLENTRIDLSEHDYFVGIWSWDRLPKAVTQDRWYKEVFTGKLPQVKAEMDLLSRSGAVAIWPDFDHVVPDWASLMALGFPGIRERARQYRAHRALTQEQAAFFDGIELQYTAVIAFIDRLYRYALTLTHPRAKIYAACLRQLRDGPPTNTYEALQLIYLYFMISESVDSYQVRSLGNGLDATLYPFYRRDLESGRFTREELQELLAYFMMQWQAIGNYWGQPFYLGGTDAHGGTLVNELSRDILQVYGELGLYNPKIQIKVSKNTPTDFLYTVFSQIRKGQGAFVFCCEPGFARAVSRYGATAEEARTMDIRGCYETGIRANEVSTATGYVNPLKAVVYALHNGFDPRLGQQVGILTGQADTFAAYEDFYGAFLAQLGSLIDRSLACSDAFEQYMGYINPSSFYSATIETSLENAFDGYQGGVKYNNSSVLLCGLGTAVDALMAVRELVYEKKLVSLPELVKILDGNWEDAPRLRAMARKCPHKYGNGDPLADTCAAEVARFFTDRVDGRKNARGGVYKALLHSAMQFLWQGQKTEATPDGRLAGDEISKNASPSAGMDRSGVTALIHSALRLTPPTFSESFCLDLMLHPSAVEGEEGLAVMKALLDTYRDGLGMALQFNIFSTEALRDAQKNPEKYQNLQVRVCGWNVLWNNLSKQEQEAYILRCENIQ